MTTHISPQPIASAAQRDSTLQRIARAYLDDSDYIEGYQHREARRLASLPALQQIVADFVSAHTDLATFRSQIDACLRHPDYDNWGARGFWLMTLNQLASNHSPQAEPVLRSTLDGLAASNVEDRSAAFAQFLADEKQRLPQQRSKLAAPGRSLFFLALFADWLNPQGGVLVPWPIMRDGLRTLLDLGALPATLNLARTRDGIRLAGPDDYAAMRQALDWCAATVPALTTVFRWWDKRLLDWVQRHRVELVDWLDQQRPDPVLIADAPLAAVPPDQLQDRIEALRRRLLVPAALIRRIYHALVLGQHVVLSGPPGTGKTELARLLPCELWRAPASEQPTSTSYTIQIATATDEWTPRHVIGGIVPVTRAGQVSYEIAYGCLARAIMENWNLDETQPESWHSARRRRVFEPLSTPPAAYRGRWLVIDELNRAPVDLALGEALTMLGGDHNVLHVPTAQGTAPLPVPQDFRIIGTLNTFDRHFLNRMSEALKRRFAFIEVLPPTRHQRAAEQAIVLQRVLAKLQPVSQGVISAEGVIHWPGLLRIDEGDQGTPWRHQWQATPAAQQLFAEGWRLFEVLRLYRQFGTAQAIAWVQSYLGAGLLDGLPLDDEPGWRACLGAALADTLADQLQVLFPDEVEVLLAYIHTRNAPDFAHQYNALLEGLTSPKRRSAHIMALQSVRDTQGTPALSPQAARAIVTSEIRHIAEDVLTALFYADQPRGSLPPLAERLERFVAERAL